jgi:site-specific recombinase XerD
LARSTKEAYLRSVTTLAAYYQCPPDQLVNDQIQEYLRHIIEDRKLAWNTCNVVLCGLVCFYRSFLKWDESRLSIPPRTKSNHLPIILSVDEVRTLLNAAINLKHHALLKTVYCAGLRVSEVVNLKPEHIESDPSRMLIRVEQGKGKKDRYTVLTTDCLETLREYWREFKPEQWIFPGAIPGQPISKSTAQKIFTNTKKKPV